MLVADVADDLLEQIFDRHETGDGAVLVDHDAHVLLFALHLAQQLVAALGFRNEGGGVQDGCDGARARLIVGDLQKVVGEGEAGDVVERAGVNGDARVVVLAQNLEKALQRDGFRDGEDFRARSHDLANQLVAELDGGAHQIAVALLEDALFLAGLDERFDIGCGFFFRACGCLGQRARRKRRSG